MTQQSQHDLPEEQNQNVTINCMYLFSPKKGGHFNDQQNKYLCIPNSIWGIVGK